MKTIPALLALLLTFLAPDRARAEDCRFPSLPPGARTLNAQSNHGWLQSKEPVPEGKVEIGAAWIVGNVVTGRGGYLIARCSGTASCPRNCQVTERFAESLKKVKPRRLTSR